MEYAAALLLVLLIISIKVQVKNNKKYNESVMLTSKLNATINDLQNNIKEINKNMNLTVENFALKKNNDIIIKYEQKLKDKESELSNLILSHQHEIIMAREDAIKKSGSIRGGFEIERLVPFFQDFPFDVRDLSFFGNPIDFMCFAGLKTKQPISIHIIEIKKDTAQLNENQKAIKDAVIRGDLFFNEFNLNSKNMILFHKQWSINCKKPKLLFSSEIGPGINSGLME